MIDTIKCVVVGDNGIGKKELLNAMAPVNLDNGRKSEKIVFDDKQIQVAIKKQKYAVSILAPNGGEDFDRMRPLLYQGTDIFIVAFSIADPYSFENVKNKWSLEIRNYSTDAGNTPFVLVGTKADIRAKSKTQAAREFVKKSDAEQLCSDLKGICYIEVSTKTKQGVNELLQTVIHHIHDKRHPPSSCCVIS